MSSLTARVRTLAPVYDFLPTTSAVTGYAKDKERSFSGVTNLLQTLEAGAAKRGLECSGKGGLECSGKRGLECSGKRCLKCAGKRGLECAGKRGLECGTSPVCGSELLADGACSVVQFVVTVCSHSFRRPRTAWRSRSSVDRFATS